MCYFAIAILNDRRHGLVPGAGNFESVFALLVHFDDKVIVLCDELVHCFSVVEAKVGYGVLGRGCT